MNLEAILQFLLSVSCRFTRFNTQRRIRRANSLITPEQLFSCAYCFANYAKNGNTSFLKRLDIHCWVVDHAISDIHILRYMAHQNPIYAHPITLHSYIQQLYISIDISFNNVTTKSTMNSEWRLREIRIGLFKTTFPHSPTGIFRPLLLMTLSNPLRCTNPRPDSPQHYSKNNWSYKSAWIHCHSPILVVSCVLSHQSCRMYRQIKMSWLAWCYPLSWRKTVSLDSNLSSVNSSISAITI